MEIIIIIVDRNSYWYSNLFLPIPKGVDFFIDMILFTNTNIINIL